MHNPQIAPLPITTGTRLGAYEIVAPIGAGGMGEVYRARDTRLERSVAIKLLPSEFAANASLKARFEREARTISALSHPNICALFDVGETGDRAYLVMEFIEGESLADRLVKGPLPVDQVLKIGVEIASALDTAHRQGIIHRDIKPGNIMITRGGAKLLDFGLAKIGEPERAASDATAVAPTEHKPITEQGTVLGTYQYMAPEQVEGLPADARTDIFALGAVLYEAATGQRAFDGKSRASLIAAILDHEPPPISVVRPMTPMSLERVIRACLRKDPNDRVQTAHDLMLQIGWIRESTSAGEGAAVARPRRLKMNWLALALLTTTLLFALLYLRARMTTTAPEMSTFSILPPAEVRVGVTLAMAPDGKALAFTGSKSGEEPVLWIRRFSDPGPRPLPGTELARWPFWSPDGQWIGFFGGGKLRRINVATGSIQDICKTSYGVGGTWRSDGTILFADRFGEGLYRVAASGGDPVAVTKLNLGRRESVHAFPHLLEDEKHFVFLNRSFPEERNQISVASIEDPTPKLLVKADSLAGVAGGKLLYVRENVLYAQDLDVRSLRLQGEPAEIARNVSYSENWATSGASVSSTGVIAYYPIFTPSTEVRLYDRGGAVVQTLFTDEGIESPQMSPDRKRLVFTRMDPKKGASDIWMVDPALGSRTVLTRGLANHQQPAWSPDGSRIAYISDGAGLYDIYVRSIDEFEAPAVIWKSEHDKHHPSWMPDGRSIMANADRPDTLEDLYVIGADGKNLRKILSTPTDEEQPAPSPDGRWIVFSSRRSSKTPDVYVMPVAGGRPLQVSAKGGEYPAWSSDGKEIFYVRPDRTVMSVRFGSGQPAPPLTLFVLPPTPEQRPFTVTPDGKFLIAALASSGSSGQHIDVVLNWR